ncbi:hypothetical protein LHYA1_G007631 [Lachnellula hyalina]|uniref:Uncharacterized protein n=1 Tax=Lachnellula hyalina TaxID=1316788 RepID=A0A8H8TX68_9HELO|nr:uncharacterized protein LHYA1_G007631 [Lachnellula hyalina]TVY23617.1 hypothetical protein LHYA1_G007631 [Lachnellula hyalina]
MSFPADIKRSNIDLRNEQHEQLFPDTPAPAPRNHRTAWISGFLSIFALYLLLSLHPNTPVPYRPCGNHRVPARIKDVATVKPLVPLEAHIMSKCPDAKDCLQQLILPAMMQIVDKVNFTLSYIGTPTANDGVECLHGPEECLGNIIELCANSLYPDPKIYLGFTMCLTKDYHDIPQKSLLEDCALEHGIDFEELNECATRDDGGFGMGMLRDSVRRSTDAGVTKSCTVRLDEKIYCVRDGGQWKDCPNGSGVNDLVIAVQKLYDSPS